MLSLLYFKYRPASRSSVCQTGYIAPASSKNVFISRFRALISSTAFMAWSLAQIFPRPVAHIIQTVPRRQRKGKHYIFLWEKRGIVDGAGIVTQKHDILCSVCPQIFHHAVQLCVAHHNKDDIVTILRFKLCDNRDAAYALPQMKDLFNL